MTKQSETSAESAKPNLFMSAEELRSYADKIDTARASKAFGGMKDAEDARKKLMDKLSRPMTITEEMRVSFRTQVRQAAEEGKTELMVLQFPVELCTDTGRAINNSEPDWPETLTGVPRQLFELWQQNMKPAGYRLTAMIVEWPNGMPGDVGLFISWGEIRPH
ncbi:hypothetical protein LJR231_001764 [Phyllobacterium sp. LjRoot231]|uniref:hypothetical protein n=1 Tax=Phyllobacterium sp. LjRoot231 TaxID=3342289 RepID=UPI003ECEB636